jgi:thioredoxin 1
MAAPQIVTLTDGDFDQQVQAHPLVLVDFWAEWCGPCRMIAPLLDELAGEYAGRVVIGKVNVDQNGQTAARFGVRSIPTLLFMKHGSRVDQIVGAKPKKDIKDKIEQHLGGA